MPHLEAPPERPHPFVYFISIINNSPETVTILGRKWILRESNGDTIVVEGEGVVGETPVIHSGSKFSYNSYHVIGCRTSVTGGFFGRDSKGLGVRVTIPPFELEPPVI
ncbi:MAG: ApaG domain-containing protein [Verrucomicrobiaceae bacterium]